MMSSGVSKKKEMMSSAQEIFPTWMAKAHHFYPCLKETAQSFVSSTVLKRKESPAHRAAPHADAQTSRLASQCPHWPTRSACRAAHRTKRLGSRRTRRSSALALLQWTLDRDEAAPPSSPKTSSPPSLGLSEVPGQRIRNYHVRSTGPPHRGNGRRLSPHLRQLVLLPLLAPASSPFPSSPAGDAPGGRLVCQGSVALGRAGANQDESI